MQLATTTRLIDSVRRLARPLRDPRDLDPLMARIGEARYVLLGEATHGTSDFYTWRAQLSRRLIEEKGFSFVAVEGDWPDCYRVNRYVKGATDAGASAEEALTNFARWPTWMWANREVQEFTEWLRGHNNAVPVEAKTGFYGLDVYSLWESMEAVLAYLDRVDSTAAAAARRAFVCFEPYRRDVQEYAWATRLVPSTCEDEVVELLSELRRKAQEFREEGREGFFNAEQNALVLKNAERYYRTMVSAGAESWNVRDRHMVETLERLMAHHGPQARAIVWEHNTHIGDARYTDMAADGMVNVGELVREQHPTADVVLVGFATHRGTVIAGSEWGAPMRRMRVPSAIEESWEYVLHEAFEGDRLMIFAGDPGPELMDPRGHRAIGVVYNPGYERRGNYVPTVLRRRYDALLHVDETAALHPIQMEATDRTEVPETFPSGV